MWVNAFAPNATAFRTSQSDTSVSVIIPARNAEDTIAATLDSILSQEYSGPLEVIVADGSDSPAMAEMIRASYPDVRVVPNPQKNIPSGLNHAIRESSGEVIVRCDTHAEPSPGYVRRIVETLKRTGAANVGGRQQATATTFFGKAVSLAMNSLLGSGGSFYRVGRTPGPTDTVYLGAWRRDMLRAVGGFDTRFLRNQDYELNWRLRRRGETIWFDPELIVEYRPRASIGALASQYWNYGRWKSRMLMLHPASLKLRQLPPPLTLGVVVSLGLAISGPLWALAFPLLYLAVLLLGSAVIGLRRREPSAILLPIALATIHLSWGIGFFIPARLPGRARRDTRPPPN